MPSFRDFSKIGEFSTNPLVLLDARAHAAYLNSAFEEMCGYEKGEVIGRNPWTLMRGENTSQTTLDFMKSKMGKHLPFETSLVQYRKDGRSFWVGIYVVPFHDESSSEFFYASLEREIKKVGEPVMSNLAFSSQVGELLSLAGK